MTQVIEREKKWDLKITLISALVGGFIALVPILLNFNFSNKQKDKEIKNRLFDKKIELLDKTTKIFYSLPSTQQMFVYGIYKNIDTVIIKYDSTFASLPKDLKFTKELSELRADFFSTLMLDQLYFGPKTYQIIDSIINIDGDRLNRVWWDTPDTSCIKILETMMKELK